VGHGGLGGLLRLGVDADPRHRLAAAFTELALAV